MYAINNVVLMQKDKKPKEKKTIYIYQKKKKPGEDITYQESMKNDPLYRRLRMPNKDIQSTLQPMRREQKNI